MVVVGSAGCENGGFGWPLLPVVRPFSLSKFPKTLNSKPYTETLNPNSRTPEPYNQIFTPLFWVSDPFKKGCPRAQKCTRGLHFRPYPSAVPFGFAFISANLRPPAAPHTVCNSL